MRTPQAASCNQFCDEVTTLKKHEPAACCSMDNVKIRHLTFILLIKTHPCYLEHVSLIKSCRLFILYEWKTLMIIGHKFIHMQNT